MNATPTLASKCLLYAKNGDGSYIKSLLVPVEGISAELLLDITPKGIHGNVVDPDDNVMVDFFLDADKFTYYYVKKEIRIMVLVSELLADMQSIKKKNNNLVLYIDTNAPDVLCVRIERVDNTFSSEESKIRIVYISGITYTSHDFSYRHMYIANSKDFQTFVKGLKHISQSLTIQAYQSQIKMFINDNGIIKKQYTTTAGDNVYGHHSDTECVLYKADIDTQHLLSILKMTSLCKTFAIYVEPEVPIKLRFSVGTLGPAEIIIKTHDLISNDK